MPATTSTRRARRWTIGAAVAVFALLSGGSVAAGAVTSDAVAAAPLAPASPEPERPVPSAVVPASGIRQCSVAEQAGDPRLHTLQARVVNAETGEVLFDRDSDVPARTASNLKVLTGAAALATFGPDYRITTPVVAGSEPGTIVLVGRGDLTLTRLPTGQESIYPGAAHLDELARQTKQAWDAAGGDAPITRIVLDTSFFGGATWHPSWDPKGMREGYQSHVTALQVDADRWYPELQYSPRGDDPVTRAGKAFAAYFPGAVVERGRAPEGAQELAAVQSAPLADLVEQMILQSDNMIAEALARLVAIDRGAGKDFAALATAIPGALAEYGIDTAGITVVDGSGLSAQNAVPNRYFTRLFRLMVTAEVDLDPILEGLPVSGRTGTLGYDDRFTGEAEAAVGHIRAKTGFIQTAYTLGGIIDAADGTTLVFSLYAYDDEPLPDDAVQAVDLLAAAFYRCGDDLSNT